MFKPEDRVTPTSCLTPESSVFSGDAFERFFVRNLVSLRIFLRYLCSPKKFIKVVIKQSSGKVKRDHFNSVLFFLEYSFFSFQFLNNLLSFYEIFLYVGSESFGRLEPLWINGVFERVFPQDAVCQKRFELFMYCLITHRKIVTFLEFVVDLLSGKRLRNEENIHYPSGRILPSDDAP